MKICLALSGLSAILFLNLSCEQQTYEDTKKFNQHVPGGHTEKDQHVKSGVAPAH